VAFSTGLSDSDSLMQQLSKRRPECRVYNYAVHGYGPQHALKLLEDTELSKQIDEAEGYGVFVFIDDHFNRLLHSTSTPYAVEAPLYELRDGQLRTYQSFAARHPVRSFFRKWIGKLQAGSYLGRMLRRTIPPSLDSDAVELAATVLTEMQRNYSLRFKGTFAVYISPLYRFTYASETTRLTRLLNERNVRVIAPPPLSTRRAARFRIPIDQHPNAAGSRLMAKQIVEGLIARDSESSPL
jgi:hypothetical protein